MRCYVVGTRPEWIHLKAFIDHERIASHEFLVVNTGQQRDYLMASQFIEELRLPIPTVSLNSSPLNFGRVLLLLPGIFRKYSVSDVCVIGDTDSALVGAIAAYRARLPLLHIEAGLRCDEPIPEEHNRRCIDALATKLLAPEDYAVSNLQREHVTGKIIRSPNYKLIIFREFARRLKSDGIVEDDRRGLLTLHRQENVDNNNRLNWVLKQLSLEDREITWPVHPRTLQRLRQFKCKIPDNLNLCPPLSYGSLVRALIASRGVYTDSGGLVLEAFELGKEIVVFRKSLEWKHVLDSSRTTTM